MKFKNSHKRVLQVRSLSTNVSSAVDVTGNSEDVTSVTAVVTGTTEASHLPRLVLELE